MNNRINAPYEGCDGLGVAARRAALALIMTVGAGCGDIKAQLFPPEPDMGAEVHPIVPPAGPSILDLLKMFESSAPKNTTPDAGVDAKPTVRAKIKKVVRR